MLRRYAKLFFLMAIVAALAMGCAAGKRPGTPVGLQPEYDEAKALFDQATGMNAQNCAPEDYAIAKANWDKVNHEWAERDYDLAAKYIPVVKEKAAEAIEKCKPKEMPKAEVKAESAVIYFDIGKADIRSDAVPVLDKVGTGLKDNPTWKIEVAGNTDNSKIETSRKGLGMKRAQSVATYLEDHYGVAADRIKVVDYGASKPVADNKTKEGRRMNRRVDITPMM